MPASGRAPSVAVVTAVACLGVFLPIAFADASPRAKQAGAATPPVFSQSLSNFYAELSAFADIEANNPALAAHFMSLAVLARKGDRIEPARLRDWQLDGQMAADARAARSALLAVQRHTMKDAPEQAALAQASFDCWLVQFPAVAGKGSESCRMRFNQVMRSLAAGVVDPKDASSVAPWSARAAAQGSEPAPPAAQAVAASNPPTNGGRPAGTMLDPVPVAMWVDVRGEPTACDGRPSPFYCAADPSVGTTPSRSVALSNPATSLGPEGSSQGSAGSAASSQGAAAPGSSPPGGRSGTGDATGGGSGSNGGAASGGGSGGGSADNGSGSGGSGGAGGGSPGSGTDAGVGASAGVGVGGSSGVGVGASAEAGAGGVSAGASASVGGSSGAGASASASVGSSGVDASVGASVGGIGVGVGVGIGADGIGVGVGGGSGAGGAAGAGGSGGGSGR